MCVYVEAVSVLPQLKMMQNAKVVEKFTAHYVFALGLSRFISCAHWILQIIDGTSFLMQAIGSGLWPAMVLLSEIVQTFILADFWYVSNVLACGALSRFLWGSCASCLKGRRGCAFCVSLHIICS